MDLLILKADNSKEMEDISQELSQKKFKVLEQDKNYILMRKRRYGNLLIQAIIFILALSVFSLLIFVNIIYFSYSFLWASPTVLITTETVSDEGEPLEFNDMDEVMDKATAIL